jgi:catechol 2,3-dioxygenase-like lactoylglutathione lyase family enzyme
MPVVKALDIAFARLQVPDMDVAEQFLLDFGLQRVERTATALYMRGTDPDPFIYVAHLGDSPRFLASAWHVESEDDLKAAARAPGASAIEDLDGPGGGKRVRVTDPLGYTVELVHGRKAAAAIPVEPVALNFGWDGLARKTLQRFDARPSKVKRIAHVVLTTPDVPPVVQWYRQTLGLVQSEDIYSGEQANIIGSFNRCDRGDAYVDHHVFFCRDGKGNGLNHVSFEVQDFDDLMLGHDLLHARKYRHMWGVGRHLLGAQVFDYWCDPWGRVHEHWTDSDRMNVQGESRTLPREAAYRSQWGPRAPQEFHGYATP